MRSSDIGVLKAESILGERVDPNDLEDLEDDYDDHMTRDVAAGGMRLLRQHLKAESKSYRELEHLAMVLENLDEWRSLVAPFRA